MAKKNPKKGYKIRKHQLKKEKKNLDEPPKSGLISKPHNPWNPKPEFNQEAQLSTNLFLKDEIIKKKLAKKTKRIMIKFNRKRA